MKRPRVVARHIAVVAAHPRTVAGIEARVPRPGASKAHGRRTALHEIVAQFLTGEHFLVGPWLDHGVDQGISAGQVTHLLSIVRILRH